MRGGCAAATGSGARACLPAAAAIRCWASARACAIAAVRSCIAASCRARSWCSGLPGAKWARAWPAAAAAAAGEGIRGEAAAAAAAAALTALPAQLGSHTVAHCASTAASASCSRNAPRHGCSGRAMYKFKIVINASDQLSRCRLQRVQRAQRAIF